MNSVSEVKFSFANLAIETSEMTIITSVTIHLTRKTNES